MAVREKVIKLVIPSGETEATVTTALDSGFVLGGELHTNHTDIDNYADFGINDDSGIPSISRPTPVSHWKRRDGAGFSDSFKPLLFETQNKTFQFKAKTQTAVAKDTYFTLVLMYKITPECN